MWFLTSRGSRGSLSSVAIVGGLVMRELENYSLECDVAGRNIWMQIRSIDGLIEAPRKRMAAANR
jgi:hypothetical protein